MTKLYAENTSVPVAQSRTEIERLLTRHKCTSFATGTDHERHRARIEFKARNRIIRFEIGLPDPADKEYRQDRHGWTLSASGIQKRVEQGERQRWRALLLVIKAKLEAVENRIASFDDEFLAQIVLPNQQTVGQYILPEVQTMYETGQMPKRLGPRETAAIDVKVEKERA